MQIVLLVKLLISFLLVLKKNLLLQSGCNLLTPALRGQQVL